MRKLAGLAFLVVVLSGTRLAAQPQFPLGQQLPQMHLKICPDLASAKKQANSDWEFAKTGWDYNEERRRDNATGCAWKIVPVTPLSLETAIRDFDAWGRVYSPNANSGFGAETDRPAPDTRVPVEMQRERVRWYVALVHWSNAQPSRRWVEIPDRPYPLAFLADPARHAITPWITAANGCRIYNPVPQPNERITWSGGCRDGLADGEGTYEFINGGASAGGYVGMVRAGKPNGAGTETLSDGVQYQGNFVDGHLTGHAHILYVGGNYYDGDTRYELREGHGVMVLTNGMRYDGEWHDDYADGRGTSTYADGGRFEGEWRHGARQGFGVLIYADGARYEGAWAGDQANGYGAMTYPNGSRYQGGWQANKRSGHGVMTWPTGQRYDGEFRNELPNGQGIYTAADGRTFSGNWTNGCLPWGDSFAAVAVERSSCQP
jgi:hypothetical protein